MSSSSAPSASVAATNPPTGWTGDDEYLFKHYYWTDKPDSLKNVFKTYYGLNDAQPIWAHDAQYGDVLFIFQALPGTIETKYYVWNGIDSVVALINAHGLDEIRETINKLGGGKGYLGELSLTVVEEKS